MSEQTEKKHTILVVDDSRVSLMHLVQILQDDYVIHTADSGVEAIQLAKVIKPDIILSDIVMPQMDGYGALTALKDIRETKDIPVIFISSLNQDINEEKGLKLGAVDYISKPYNPTIVKLRVSVQLKIVEQMRTIRSLSLSDPLTGLPNRTHFDSRLREEWDRAKHDEKKLGVLLIDVDRLKTFNSIHGYLKGDEGLIEMSNIVKRIANKPGTVISRWADDGFAVLIIGADGPECNSIGEEIRKAAENFEFKISGDESAQFTLSIGANSVAPHDTDGSLEQFVSNADSALYLAKELGRNMVVVHS